MPHAADTLAPPFTIAGVDEVGRGPLAGPVVAAAVMLDPARPVDGLDDSKRLGETDRERLDALIRRRSLAWCVASASVAEIDRLNILQASLLAMQRAVAGLVARDGGARDGGVSDESAKDGNGEPASAPFRTGGAVRGAVGEEGPDDARGHLGNERGESWPADPFGGRAAAPGVVPALVLVDGNRCPVLPYPSAPVVGGDGRVRAIAAASIVAKVARDALMRRWHEHHPGFGFAAHKGYATKAHREALERLGATPLHRRSFAPVRAALARGAADGHAAGRPAPGRSAFRRDASSARTTDESPSPSEP